MLREFYLLYRDDKRVQPLVAQIGRTHTLVIFQRCKDPLDREFYIRMTRKFGWSKNVLIHQIDNQSYEKSLLVQTYFDQALTPELCAQAKLAVKDEYTFGFLELGEKHSERELERALIARIEDYLRAMGGMFAFHGQPIPTGGGRQRVFHRSVAVSPPPALGMDLTVFCVPAIPQP